MQFVKSASHRSLKIVSQKKLRKIVAHFLKRCEETRSSALEMVAINAILMENFRDAKKLTREAGSLNLFGP